MKASQSRRLVVDTSVVHAAGESEHPVSSACRDILDGILQICHRVVMTKDILVEWKQHISGRSNTWKASMARKGKYPINVIPKRVTIDTERLSDTDHRVIEKDRILLEAALSADNIIITLDEEFQNALAKTPQGPNLLRSITWINPTDGCDILLNL